MDPITRTTIPRARSTCSASRSHLARITRWLILLAVAASSVGCGGFRQHVIVVRHAERLTADETTPLSAAGLARAQELAHVAGSAGVAAVFVTDKLRSQQTGQPLAAAAGVSTTQYASIPALITAIDTGYSRKTVVVVGHSDTIAGIVTALGASETVTVGGTQFDQLFVVTRYATGSSSKPTAARVLRLKYGAATP